VTEHDIPQERDLPTGRLAQLKDDLMAQIDHDLESAGTEPQATPVAGRHRWRRAALVAATVAAGFGIATPLVLGGGNDRASANTAVRNADGEIVITLREGKNPKDLQRRLQDLDVPAVVDFLDSGYGCDTARSTGWSQEPPPEDLFTRDLASSNGLESTYILRPDLLEPGETVAFEIQIDEFGDEFASAVRLHVSTSPVGECVPVRDASIVDAERGIAGG
jgi:hypothetical protein